MDIHVYLHDSSERATGHTAEMLAHLRALVAQVVFLMPTLKEIQQKVTDLQAAVAAQTQVDTSIVTLLQGLTAMIASLKQQLADAIAANDPAAVQAVLDALTNAEATVKAETQKLADAAVANTPAA